jgi:hypothetical protein
MEHCQCLSREDRVAAIPTIRQDSGHGRDQSCGDLGGEPDYPQEKGRLGQLVHEPEGRDLLHPGADQGDPLAEEEQPEVAMDKGTPQTPQPRHLLVISYVACRCRYASLESDSHSCPPCTSAEDEGAGEYQNWFRKARAAKRRIDG